MIRGDSVCHSYQAGIVWDETTFRIVNSGPFRGLNLPEPVCHHPEGAAERDAAYVAALDDVDSYQASDELLVMYDRAGQPRLAFIPRLPVTVDSA